MPERAQSSRVYDEYLDRLAGTKHEDLTYRAVSLVGPRNQVSKLVGKLSLLRWVRLLASFVPVRPGWSQSVTRSTSLPRVRPSWPRRCASAASSSGSTASTSTLTAPLSTSPAMQVSDEPSGSTR